MEGRLLDAVRKVNDRKRAAGATEEAPVGGGREIIGWMLTGLDLEPGEVEHAAQMILPPIIGEMVSRGSMEISDLRDVMASVWLDGLATGAALEPVA